MQSGADAMMHPFSTGTHALLANARRYRDHFRPGAPRKPRTRVFVLTCMDARINVYALLGLTDGDAHIVRNAGGVVTDDVIRSLTISQRLLETTDVMIIMHAACGLRDITDEQFTAAVQADVGLRPTWQVGTFRDVTAEAHRGVARLRNSPFLPHTNAIRGFCFDETSGALHELC
jgi:carbonic anhydrase